MSLAIFSDFDGTLTDRDTIDHLVEHFLGSDYRREMTRRLLAGEISIRDALSEEFTLVSQRQGLTLQQVEAFMAEHITVDPHLPELLRWAQRHGVAFTILSSGMDRLILPLLQHAGCGEVAVRCNRLVEDQQDHGGVALRIEYRDDSDNGHRKAEVLRAAKVRGQRTLFMGDGLTDLECAEVADILFARRRLAMHCDQHGIAYHPLNSCADVLRYLENSGPVHSEDTAELKLRQ